MAILFTLGSLLRHRSQPEPEPKLGSITTVAGCELTAAQPADANFDGEGGPAPQARIWLPVGVALDGHESLYIVGRSHNRLFKITPDGVIRTVAGSGPFCKGIYRKPPPGLFSGDGGPARLAHLNQPSNVVMDRRGNAFVADTMNDCVRRITPQGRITTVAGTGPRRGPSPRPRNGDGGPATLANLSHPTGLAFDAQENLYIADTDHHCIRKMNAKGTISTVAGGLPGALPGPEGTFSGDGGPARKARLNRPAGVAVNAHGELFIADTDNHRIRKVDRRGIISTVAGTGKMRVDEFGKVVNAFCGDHGRAKKARLNRPMGMAFDIDGALYVADSGNHRIRKIGWDGIITTLVGGGEPRDNLGDAAMAFDARLDTPTALAVDGGGNLYIADQYNHRIRKVIGVAAPGLWNGRPFPSSSFRGKPEI